MGDKDILSKTLLKRLLLEMANRLCGLDIVEAELLGTEEQRIEDRRADLVAKVRPRRGGPFILHIEVQNDNDPNMVSRMLRYLSDIQLAHPGLPVHQCLIYIGRERLTMAAGQSGPQLVYRYQLIDMRSVGYRTLFDQGTPESLVLSVLCDFQGESAGQVVRHILRRLEALTGDNEKLRREYLEMLEILADNRKLNIDIKEAYDMLQINIERLPSYQKGMEKGIEQGLEKGLDKGLEKGLEKGIVQGLERGSEIEARLLLQRALAKRFGDLPETLRGKIEQASLTELERWFDRAMDTEKIGDVFTDPD